MKRDGLIHRFDAWIDSYNHYRSHVGCGRLHAAYRAFYYELRGREPRRYRGAP